MNWPKDKGYVWFQKVPRKEKNTKKYYYVAYTIKNGKRKIFYCSTTVILKKIIKIKIRSQ